MQVSVNSFNIDSLFSSFYFQQSFKKPIEIKYEDMITRKNKMLGQHSEKTHTKPVNQRSHTLIHNSYRFIKTNPHFRLTKLKGRTRIAGWTRIFVVWSRDVIVVGVFVLDFAK